MGAAGTSSVGKDKYCEWLASHEDANPPSWLAAKRERSQFESERPCLAQAMGQPEARAHELAAEHKQLTMDGGCVGPARHLKETWSSMGTRKKSHLSQEGNQATEEPEVYERADYGEGPLSSRKPLLGVYATPKTRATQRQLERLCTYD